MATVCAKQQASPLCPDINVWRTVQEVQGEFCMVLLQHMSDTQLGDESTTGNQSTAAVMGNQVPLPDQVGISCPRTVFGLTCKHRVLLAGKPGDLLVPRCDPTSHPPVAHVCLITPNSLCAAQRVEKYLIIEDRILQTG